MDRNQPLALANARLVLADEVIEGGWIVAENGVIAAFGRGALPAKAEDMGGDLLIPGLVELHTDHIEAHYMPRPKVHRDPLSAVVSYDAQLATCGITTVLDSLRGWREEGAEDVGGEAVLLASAIATARDADMLRITHYLHLRCEVPMPRVVEEACELIGRDDVRLVSLMDHTPGQRGCACSWAHPISSAAAPIPATSRPRIWRGRACSTCCPRTTSRQAS
jgi:alpha-D-ribose 1-methylphosphonate 5-triphosphate diphosphatase